MSYSVRRRSLGDAPATAPAPQQSGPSGFWTAMLMIGATIFIYNAYMNDEPEDRDEREEPGMV